MQRFGVLAAVMLLQSCAMRTDSLDWRWKTTYYDRNHDGRVDFEFHHMEGGADTDWAYVDTQFRGRYDLRIHWGYSVTRNRVNIPVPRFVTIAPGQPPVKIPK